MIVLLWYLKRIQNTNRILFNNGYRVAETIVARGIVLELNF